MSWFKKLQQRWGISPIRVVLVLIVFACTGFTVLFLKKPVLRWVLADKEPGWIFSVIYYILIFPIYNVILLIYGFLLGQFKFFWKFEKRMFSKMFGNKKSS